MASASKAEKTSADKYIARAEREYAYAREQGEKNCERLRIVYAKMVLFTCRALVKLNALYMEISEELGDCGRKNRSRYLRLTKQKVTLWKEVTSMRQELRRKITKYVLECSRNMMNRLIDVRQLLGVKANNLANLFSKGDYKFFKNSVVADTLRIVCLTNPDDDEAIERGELKFGIVGYNYGMLNWHCYGVERILYYGNKQERKDVMRTMIFVDYLDRENNIIEFDPLLRVQNKLPHEKVQLPFDLIETAQEILDRKAYRPKSVFIDQNCNLRFKVPLFHIRKIMDTELFRMIFFNKTSSVYNILPVDVLKIIYEHVLEPYR